MSKYLYQKHHQYFAQHSSGAEEAARFELLDLGAQSIKEGYLGYYFTADRESIYRIVYMTRICTRILAPLINFECHSTNYLYKTAKQINWNDFLTLTKTFAITCNTSNSKLRNSDYASKILKDAIVDQFRENYGERPSVNKRYPDLQLNLYIHQNIARISVDLGGGSLHRRGYRTEKVTAPIQENVAATILRLSEWNGKNPLYDPFCGSGTILIEALMKITNFPSARFRSKFGFLRLPDFDPTLWNQIKNKMNQSIQHLDQNIIYGSDIDRNAIEITKTHLSKFDEHNKINVEMKDFRSIQSLNNHCIVTNPPYGIRISSSSETTKLLKEFGDFLKQKCTGSTAFIYFGEPALFKNLGLKPDKKWPLRTGGLDGLLCRYPLY